MPDFSAKEAGSAYGLPLRTAMYPVVPSPDRVLEVNEASEPQLTVAYEFRPSWAED